MIYQRPRVENYFFNQILFLLLYPKFGGTGIAPVNELTYLTYFFTSAFSLNPIKSVIKNTTTAEMKVILICFNLVLVIV